MISKVRPLNGSLECLSKEKKKRNKLARNGEGKRKKSNGIFMLAKRTDLER